MIDLDGRGKESGTIDYFRYLTKRDVAPQGFELFVGKKPELGVRENSPPLRSRCTRDQRRTNTGLPMANKRLFAAPK